MKFFEIQVHIFPFENEINEILIAYFSELDFDNFIENDDGFSAYSNIKPDTSLIDSIIDKYAPKNLKIKYQINEIDNKNWNEEWEKNIQPLVINDKCLIYTSFHSNLPKCEYEILIDPKMSFGTGHHQTTEMMVKYILETDFTNKTVLDAGCGTGILAILASKRGASELVAFDYDDICVENSMENVQKNKINNISILKADENHVFDRKFDIILANINRNVLLSYSKMFSDLLNKEGKIVMSGFYEDDIKILNNTYSENFKLISKKSLNNWSSIMLQKTQGNEKI
ncbi:MAG: hypothetical protein A2046_06655 [Bacteroidetes bacterium GWA2_30_7]|nr:MAG: hypothetical protein A2046_06655 [Bacteroidetes bacterium GWA2_30_7]